MTFVLAIMTYLLMARMIGDVFDPLWLVASGFHSGHFAIGLLGLFLCVHLIPAMFWWLLQPCQASYLTAMVSAGIWLACCWMIREVALA